MSESSNSPPSQHDFQAPKRKATQAGLEGHTTGRSVKRRASKACQCCRARKVRCNVTEHGAPCTNCRLDEVECIVSESRRKKSVNPRMPASDGPSPIPFRRRPSSWSRTCRHASGQAERSYSASHQRRITLSLKLFLMLIWLCRSMNLADNNSGSGPKTMSIKQRPRAPRQPPPAANSLRVRRWTASKPLPQLDRDGHLTLRPGTMSTCLTPSVRFGRRVLLLRNHMR